MGWISADDLHEAYVVPVFVGGDVGGGLTRSGPDGLEVIVELVVGERGVAEAERAAAAGEYLGDRRFYCDHVARASGELVGEWARPLAEVVGWQLMCECSSEAPPWTKIRWEGPMITRVPSKALERRDVADSEGLAFYAPKGVIDRHLPQGVQPLRQHELDGDTPEEELIRELWRRHHLDAATSTTAIKSAARDLQAAHRRLDQAVSVARDAGVTWEHVGRAAGMTKQAANSRWSTPHARTIDEFKEREAHLQAMTNQRADVIGNLDPEAWGMAYATVLGLLTPTLVKTEEGRAAWKRAWAEIRPAEDRAYAEMTVDPELSDDEHRAAARRRRPGWAEEA